MGITKYLRALYKRPREALKEIYDARLQQLRREPTTVRLEHPTRLDRARALGYKAKQGFFVVRQQVGRGNHIRSRRGLKRKPSRMGIRVNLDRSYQQLAEMRAAKKFVNCEVLNSYWLAEDGHNKWYEVIMVDPNHPVVQKDKSTSWIANAKHTGRVFRGKTSAGRRSRALHKKGKGVEKARPSQAAHGNRLK